MSWADLAFARFHIAHALRDLAATSGQGWKEAAEPRRVRHGLARGAQLGQPEPVPEPVVALVNGRS